MKTKPLTRIDQLKVGTRIYAEIGDTSKPERQGERAIGYVVAIGKVFADSKSKYYTLYVMNINNNNEVFQQWTKDFPASAVRDLMKKQQIKYIVQ